MAVPLKRREWSREMGHVEKQNYFHKENQGYVRYVSKRNGYFCLNPSKDLISTKNEAFILKNPPAPEEGTFIRVTVSETEPMKEPDGRGGLKVTYLKFVSSWETFKVCDMLKAVKSPGFEDVLDRGMQQEEFLDFMSLTVKRKFLTQQLQYSLCLYAVASPEISEYQKGGINTTILTKSQANKKWNKWKRITSVIPPEYKKSNAEHFYKNVEAKALDPDLEFYRQKSREISLAYQNNLAVPVEVPLPLNVEFRTVADIKEDFKINFAAGRNFLLDAVLIEPEIPDSEHRHLLDSIYDFSDEFRSMCNAFHYTKNALRISASLLVRLSSSFARFNFEPTVNRDNIKESVNLWADLQREVVKTGMAAKKYKDFYMLATDEKIVFTELEEMKETGVNTTVTNLRAITKVSLIDLNDILASLARKHFIYFINNETIGFIED